jgi:RNA polymerase sigma factor (TIGR02999 family)
VNPGISLAAFQPDITRLLQAWTAGNTEALEQLLPLVHEELHRIAHCHMRAEQQGRTLETTALVNETYIRLVDSARVRWEDRAHFFALSSQLMRRILVDAARARGAAKRWGPVARTDFAEALVVAEDRGPALTALDDALQKLEQLDSRKAKVVEMRFFGGLSAEETAHVLGISTPSVLRDWKLAKAWLARELQSGRVIHGANDGGPLAQG